MKKGSKIASSLVASALLLSLTTGTGVSASNIINELVPTAPSVETTISPNGGITTYGSSKPGSSASIHDVSVSNYNYQVSKIGYAVFTDKWLTGVTSMSVSVSSFSVDSDWGGTKNSLTIGLYTSSGEVESKTINPNNTSSVTFKNLSKTTKYYIRFSVPNNGNEYSFNGAIS